CSLDVKIAINTEEPALLPSQWAEAFKDAAQTASRIEKAAVKKDPVPETPAEEKVESKEKPRVEAAGEHKSEIVKSKPPEKEQVERREAPVEMKAEAAHAPKPAVKPLRSPSL